VLVGQECQGENGGEGAQVRPLSEFRYQLQNNRRTLVVVAAEREQPLNQRVVEPQIEQSGKDERVVRARPARARRQAGVQSDRPEPDWIPIVL